MSGLVAAIRSARVYDVSPVIRTGMPVCPGHPPVVVEPDARTHQRDGYFLQTISMGEHAGSHVDAPAHVLAGSPEATIDSFPVERFVTPYALFDLSSARIGGPDPRSVFSGAPTNTPRCGAEPSPMRPSTIRMSFGRKIAEEGK